MIGFKLDPITNDLTASGGKITLLSTVQEAVRQRLSVKFKTWQGEWFLDTTYGMPYRQQIIGKGLSQREIDALYIAEVNEDPDVQRIVYFTSEYNPYTRLYDLDFEVRVADQLLRVTTVNSTPNEEIEYPTPDGSALTPSCDAFIIGQYLCELHHTVHCDLAPEGESTWVYPSTFNPDFECVGYYETDYADIDYVGYSCDEFVDLIYSGDIKTNFPSYEYTPPTSQPDPIPVYAPTIVTDLPDTTDVLLNDQFTLTVEATGTTPLTYTWQKLNAGESVWQVVYGQNSNTYTITALDSLDGARFRCVVSNNYGSVTSSSTLITFSEVSYLKITGGGFTIPSITVDSSITTTSMPLIRTDRSADLAIPTVKVTTIDEITSIVRDDYVVNLLSDTNNVSTHRAIIDNLIGGHTYFATVEVTSGGITTSSSVNINVL